jgi:mannose-6-phosphate isomerase-like protein (cupin superfamily)
MGNSNRKPFIGNIEKETLDNNLYRKVIYTTENIQLVLMSLKPKEDIGNEKHSNLDQFIRIEKGNGIVIFNQGKINEEKYILEDGIAIVIPANTWHNIINNGKKELKLYTIYTKPEHAEELQQVYKKYIKYKTKYINLKNNIY